MPVRHTFVRGFLALALASSAARVASGQKATPDVLMARGLAAYNALPDVPTLKDANGFSNAIQNLFAYEQRTYRDGRKLAPEAARDLSWMLDRLDAFKVGKGDDPARLRDDDQLRTRGMALYKDVRASESNGVIWEVSGYISAKANLFAYLQCANDPDADARSAYAWLDAARGRLVKAGAKGDQIPPKGRKPESWIDHKPRPGAKKVTPADVAKKRSTPATAAAKTKKPPSA